MDPSSHMENFLEECIKNTLGLEKKKVNPRDKGACARQVGASRGRLQGR